MEERVAAVLAWELFVVELRLDGFELAQITREEVDSKDECNRPGDPRSWTSEDA